MSWFLTRVLALMAFVRSRTCLKFGVVSQDHLLDAKRYLLMQLFDMGPPEQEAAALSVEEMLVKERNDMLTVQPVSHMLAMRKQSNILEGRW